MNRVAQAEELDRADPVRRQPTAPTAAWPLATGDRNAAGLVRLDGPAAGAVLLRLQHGAGNRAVGALLQRCSCGTCGCESSDLHEEQEARTLSRAVLQLKEKLRSTRPTIQREEGEETGGAVALDDAPAGATGGAAGGATFNHTSTTVSIDADSAPDFSNRITSTIGTPHTEIELNPDVQYDFKTGPGDKEVPGSQKITSVGVAVNTKIVKVRFGKGRPNDKHKKAIDEMVAAIDAHEAQHRAIIVAEANAAVKKAQKLVGTNKVKQAFKILDEDLDCAAAKAHEALDAKEGLLTAAEQANGDVTITKSASGAKYPCKGGGKTP